MVTDVSAKVSNCESRDNVLNINLQTATGTGLLDPTA
jgi:hypothetical protein